MFGRYYSVIALGDFNFPSKQWIEGSGFTCSSSGDDFAFASLLMDLYLFQLVEQPTRGNNILDLVLTNSPTFISEPRTGPPLSDIGLSSDHHPVLFDFEIDVNIKESVGLKRFDFKNADFESLKQALLLTPLTNGMYNVNSIEDFDSLWELWNDFVFAALDTCVPKVNCKRSNRPP